MTRLSRVEIFRVIQALAADEIGRARGRPAPAHEWAAWTLQTRLDEDGVGIDSVDRLAVVQRVNEFFHLHEVGTEDYLVVAETLGDWVDVVEQTLRTRFEVVTVRSGGSTGAPAATTHKTADLLAEVECFSKIYPRISRIWAFTPPHHIYGFLHATLLSARLGVEVVEGRAAAPTAIGRLRDGDLAVATPTIWRRLLSSGARPERGAIGVSSGAPTPADVFEAADAAGLSRFFEVYGSTETAGVGWRDAADAPFRLLPRWRRGVDAASGADALIDPAGATMTPPDRLRWCGETVFRPVGRRDKAIQVAGVNVSLEGVRAAMLDHPLVRDCAVRVDAADPDGRLKAFVALADLAIDDDAAAAALTRHVAERLPAPARPKRFRFGPSLPTDAMGKAADWDGAGVG